ncbi:hypothetical protein [Catellatospora sichuanensis]|uniref:hypothetical protein n=1 Tax=Catellatospora sichuanensis TaxID=1969805 RepID=UPI00118272A6|nr:hypothetical protein [Catellatospora sichuanensis]
MAATVRPDQGAALLTAAVPLALAWLIDHGITIADADFVAQGAVLPGTSLGVRILIWLPLWALALAAGVLVAAGRERGVLVAPAAALREAARRAVDILAWLVPYAVTVAVLYATMRWLAYGTSIFLVGLLALASPLLILPARALLGRFPALPLRLFENAGRSAATHAAELRKDRSAPSSDLTLLLIVPLPVALLLGLAGDLLSAVLPAAVAPLIVGVTSAFQLLVVSVLVAQQARATAGRYLRPRADGDPGRAADLALVDATLSRLAGPRVRSVPRAWLAAYALPAVLLAAAAVVNPGGRPVLATADTAQWPKVVGLDPQGLPVIVAQATVTRCRDLRCAVRTTAEITRQRIDAASVTPDGGVVALHVPGLGYGEQASQTLTLVECDAADRCAERPLRLDVPDKYLLAVSVTVLPAGGVLLVAGVNDQMKQPADDRDVAAWRCKASCAEVALDSAEEFLPRPSAFVTAYDRDGGGPIVMWTDGGGQDDDPSRAYRAFCGSRDCDRLYLRPVPAVWQDLPGSPDLAGVGLDDRGDLVVAVSRPGRLSCFEWCMGGPSLDPMVLSVVRCLAADCSTRTAEVPWLRLGRYDLPSTLVTAGPRGPIVVQVTADGPVTACVANCGP